MSDYQVMSKPRAVEGVLDLYLIRPLGSLLARLFRRTPVTPNVVSLLSVAAGAMSGWYFYRSVRAGGDLTSTIAAAGLLLLHSALDSADGQLARLTGRSTDLGRFLDGLCDALGFLSLYVGLLAGSMAYRGELLPGLALFGLLAGYSQSVQCALVDHQRQLYLHHVHRSDQLLRASAESLESRYARSPSRLRRFLARFGGSYLRNQRRWLGSSQVLFDRVAELRAAGELDEELLRDRMETRQAPLLKLWALVALNSHKLGLLAALLLPVGPGSPLGELGAVWYFGYSAVVLNGLMAFLIIRQRRVDRAVLGELGPPPAP